MAQALKAGYKLFNTEQDAHIVEYLLKFISLEPSQRTQWKKRAALEILKSPLFAGDKLADEVADPKNGGTPATWEQRILKKFKNGATAAKKKVSKPGAGPSVPASVHLGGGGKSFFGRPPLTGRRLFYIENKDAIKAAASAAAAAAGCQRLLDHFQPAWKKLWEEVDDKEQADYVERVNDLQNDVAINQELFMSSMWFDIDAFCDPEDRLHTGRISVHSEDQPYFEEDNDESGSAKAWKVYVEKSLLAHVLPSNSQFEIKVGADGVPVFPRIDVMSTSPAAVIGVLHEFVRRVWAHCWASHSSFTWEEAATKYDKLRYKLPVPMEAFESLNGTQAIQLAEFFMSLGDEGGFVFTAGVDVNEEDSGDGEGDADGDGEVGKGKGKRVAGKAPNKDKAKGVEGSKDDEGDKGPHLDEGPDNGKSGKKKKEKRKASQTDIAIRTTKDEGPDNGKSGKEEEEKRKAATDDEGDKGPRLDEGPDNGKSGKRKEEKRRAVTDAEFDSSEEPAPAKPAKKPRKSGDSAPAAGTAKADGKKRRRVPEAENRMQEAPMLFDWICKTSIILFWNKIVAEKLQRSQSSPGPLILTRLKDEREST
ncbi:hypothetical protein B0H17DRAFT_1211603 [Mycena rosella]|uniref:Uncharacterized protein n=1 Tax=Mycena rosella TaxID=1033263 RepID=A0AAD7CUQ1_MYCRO|nr:hypothetical protein B0H17DRAFT_1211603 [Mycena rosella]